MNISKANSREQKKKKLRKNRDRDIPSDRRDNAKDKSRRIKKNRMQKMSVIEGE